MENSIVNRGQNIPMENFNKTDDILKDMCEIIDSSRNLAYKTVNSILIQRNWMIGYRIESRNRDSENDVLSSATRE